MDRKLIDYLPPVLREVLDFKAISAANEPEIAIAWDGLARVMANQFLATADESGVDIWEREQKIQSKNTDSLETRKTRLKALWNLELPYSIPWLKLWLSTVCGPGNYAVEMGDYTLVVKVALAAKSIYGDVGSMLKRVNPSNMVVTLLQLFNSHADLARYTHAQLAAYSHYQLRNEVLPK